MCAFAMAVNSYVKFFIRNAELGMVVSFWLRKDVTLLLLAMKMTYPELFLLHGVRHRGIKYILYIIYIISPLCCEASLKGYAIIPVIL